MLDEIELECSLSGISIVQRCMYGFTPGGVAESQITYCWLVPCPALRTTLDCCCAVMRLRKRICSTSQLQRSMGLH